MTNSIIFISRMEKNLFEMFKGLNESYRSLESRLKAEGFKVRIMKIFRTWEEWAVYSREYLIRLQNTFLGISTKEAKDDSADVDGIPISDKEEEEDGETVPLDGAALLKVFSLLLQSNYCSSSDIF